MGHMTPYRCQGNCFCKCQCFLWARIQQHESLACRARVSGAIRRTCEGVTENLNPDDYAIYATIDDSDGNRIYAGPLIGMPSVIKVITGVTYNVSVYQLEGEEYTGTLCQDPIQSAEDSYTVEEEGCDICSLEEAIDCEDEEYELVDPCTCFDLFTGELKSLGDIVLTLTNADLSGFSFPVGMSTISVGGIDISGTYFLECDETLGEIYNWMDLHYEYTHSASVFGVPHDFYAGIAMRWTTGAFSGFFRQIEILSWRWSQPTGESPDPEGNSADITFGAGGQILVLGVTPTRLCEEPPDNSCHCPTAMNIAINELLGSQEAWDLTEFVVGDFEATGEWA